MKVLLEQQAQYMKDLIEQQAATNLQNMNAMAQMLNVVQEDMRTAAESRTHNKENLTAKRAFSLLPTYTGKVEEYDTWRFQMVQFLCHEKYFPKFMEWIETELEGEDHHEQSIQQKELENQTEANDAIDLHSEPPTAEERKEEKEMHV